MKTKQSEYNVGERLTKEKCFEQPTEGWQCLYWNNVSGRRLVQIRCSPPRGLLLTVKCLTGGTTRWSVRLFTVSSSRTFNISALRIWNALPEDVVSAPSLSTFWRWLKTFLFQQSYLHLVIWLYIWHHSGPWSDFSYLGRSNNYWTELNGTESFFLKNICILDVQFPLRREWDMDDLAESSEFVGVHQWTQQHHHHADLPLLLGRCSRRGE